MSDWLSAVIAREFAGHGVAVREKDAPPILGEPLMSMAVAMGLARVIALEAMERAAMSKGGGENAAAQMSVGMRERMIEVSVRPVFSVEARGDGHVIITLGSLDDAQALRDALTSFLEFHRQRS